MEEKEELHAATDLCKDASESQIGNATGDVSSHSNATVEVSSLSGDPGSGPQKSVDTSVKKPKKWSRLQVFNKVMEVSLKKFISHASFNSFASAYHPLFRITERIHNEVIAQLELKIKEEVVTILEDGDIPNKLQKLDELAKEAKNCSQPAWRPSGVAECDMRCRVDTIYEKQRRYMEQKLRQIRKKNVALAERARAGRDAIDQTEQRLAAVVEEWKTVTVDQLQTLATSFPPDAFRLMTVSGLSVHTVKRPGLEGTERSGVEGTNGSGGEGTEA